MTDWMIESWSQQMNLLIAAVIGFTVVIALLYILLEVVPFFQDRRNKT